MDYEKCKQRLEEIYSEIEPKTENKIIADNLVNVITDWAQMLVPVIDIKNPNVFYNFYQIVDNTLFLYKDFDKAYHEFNKHKNKLKKIKFSINSRAPDVNRQYYIGCQNKFETLYHKSSFSMIIIVTLFRVVLSNTFAGNHRNMLHTSHPCHPFCIS